METVRARISKTNRFREVTLRREPEIKPGNANHLYDKTPAYMHVNRKTVSGSAYETNVNVWTFIPSGKNRNLVYKTDKKKW